MHSHDTTGQLTFLDQSTAPSLYRNGRIFTRRDEDGNDHDYTGLSTEKISLSVHNGRVNGDAPTLHKSGFELIETPAMPTLDYLDHHQVISQAYPEAEEILKQVCGARDVYAFDHNIRWQAGNQASTRIVGGQKVQKPIYFVHGDYTLTSAPQRLRDLSRPPSANDTLRPFLDPGDTLLDAGRVAAAIEGKQRYAIINVWRNIAEEPVTRDPLALCDGQTVGIQDLSVFEIQYADRVGENYFARRSPDHDWYYYPRVTPDEAILIKQWDSWGELARSSGARPDCDGDPQTPCTFSFHSAFEDPKTPADAPERKSIEIRCVLLYGD